jgi:hypothetical protein
MRTAFTIASVIFILVITFSVRLHNDAMNVALNETERVISAETKTLEIHQALYDSMNHIKTKSFSMPRNEAEDICCVELDSLLRRMDKMEYRLRSSRSTLQILEEDKERYQERILKL